MDEYKEFFSEENIVRYLAKKRAKAAKAVHDKQFLKNVSHKPKNPFNPKAKNKIYQLLPKRNCWIRFKKNERIKFPNSLALNAAQIERTVWREHKKVENGLLDEPHWHKNLFKLVNLIRDKALSESDTTINSPKLIPVLKRPESNEYRLICYFEDYVDQIIVSQTTRYLTNKFDPLFKDCSFAFRSKHDDKNYSHHEAVREIIKFKNGYSGRRLYAAECDIQKFYDSISHEVIILCFEKLLGQLCLDKVSLDQRAISYFYSYLACYAFSKDVYGKEQLILSDNNIKKGSIPWIDKLYFEKVGTDIYKDRIGVSQGGALSCLIANIVLHFADIEVKKLNLRTLLYTRFCDDIIIIHSKKKQCRKAFEVYKRALNDLKLVAHPSEKIEEYGPEFWNIKTKEPYVWQRNNKRHYLAKKNIPWLAFVGYQVRYDGLVRVRPNSIKKELIKQVEETNQVIRNIPDGSAKRLNKRNIVFRFSQRLIAMSVGRVNKEHLSMCWTSGFNVLAENKIASRQIKRLDQNRNEQIYRVEKHLEKFTDNFDEELTPDQRRFSKFYGHPYSYFKQFKHK